MNIRNYAQSIALIALGTPLLAFAALGGSMASIQTDQLKMKAIHMRAIPVTVASSGKYTVYELQMPSGTMVREYADSNGRVFAVAWDGPSKPDMNQLLGEYFAQYADGPTTGGANRQHVLIAKPGLVVQSSGHMRAFSGKAYLPQLLPEGVTVEELQ